MIPTFIEYVDNIFWALMGKDDAVKFVIDHAHWVEFDENGHCDCYKTRECSVLKRGIQLVRWENIKNKKGEIK